MSNAECVSVLADFSFVHKKLVRLFLLLHIEIRQVQLCLWICLRIPKQIFLPTFSFQIPLPNSFLNI